jgi:four helix bundle protein
MEDGRYRLDDFELYKIAREFRKRTYHLIKLLPHEEKYGLANQMRRAALSVTNNIAEGHGRWHYQENICFCMFSRRSVDELIDDFNVCLDEKYGQPTIVEGMKTAAYELIRRINGYIPYLRKTKQGEE